VRGLLQFGHIAAGVGAELGAGAETGFTGGFVVEFASGGFEEARSRCSFCNASKRSGKSGCVLFGSNGREEGGLGVDGSAATTFFRSALNSATVW
jgi:hypothetical protein